MAKRIKKPDPTVAGASQEPARPDVGVESAGTATGAQAQETPRTTSQTIPPKSANRAADGKFKASSAPSAKDATAAIPGTSVSAQVAPKESTLEFAGVPAAPKKRGQGSPTYAVTVSAKARKAQAEQTGLVILTIVDGMIQTLLYPECAMTADERAMIEPPLYRILERLDPGLSSTMEKFTDPVMLGMGLVMWGLRIFQVVSDKNAEKPRPQPQKAQPTKPVMEPGGDGQMGQSTLAQTLLEREIA